MIVLAVFLIAECLLFVVVVVVVVVVIVFVVVGVKIVGLEGKLLFLH